jgi:hypothetical protein
LYDKAKEVIAKAGSMPKHPVEMPTPLDISFVPPEDLEVQLRGLGPNNAVTHGHYETESGADVRDLDWNHMDPHHRPHIHRTYQESVRLCAGRDFQVSITSYRNLPLFVLVTDIRIRPGLFYQCFSVFNLVFVVSVIKADRQASGTRVRVDWYIVSNRLLKFVHGWLDRRLAQLNRVQNEEDAPIRERRRLLRSKGYRFKSDEPDYLISISLENHTVPPPLSGDRVIMLEVGDRNGLSRFAVEEQAFLYRFADGRLQIWPAVCPHEGGPLDEGRLSDGRLRCPWHGLSFVPIELSDARPAGRIGNAAFRISGNQLTISPLGQDGAMDESTAPAGTTERMSHSA